MTAAKIDTIWSESYHTRVWLTPGVTCSITSDTNMVTIFLNGSGDVFVDASDSVLYMDDVHFLAAGSGVLQVVVKELWSVRGVRVGVLNASALVDYSVARIVVINGDQGCVASTTDGSKSSVAGMYNEATGGNANSPIELCSWLETPPKLRDTSSLLGESPVPKVASGVPSLSTRGVCIAAALLMQAMQQVRLFGLDSRASRSTAFA